jgi:very-short-patch-repair endonuclease
MAVRDREQPGRYLIGIETDGATYHSAKWARDRDRLRQEILEKLGWRIHRVWSTDWFQHQEAQLDQIKLVLEQAEDERVESINASG